MLPSDERRLKVEEAHDRREWRERFLYPLLPEAPADYIPLQGVMPTLREQRKMERQLIDSIRERQRRRGEWTE